MPDVLQTKSIQAIQDLDRVTVLDAHVSNLEANERSK